MYCPNCGTSQSAERPAACERCQLPLGPVSELLAANRDAIEREERMARERRDRMIGAGVFALLAAGPIAWGLWNGLAPAVSPRDFGRGQLPEGGRGAIAGQTTGM